MTQKAVKTDINILQFRWFYLSKLDPEPRFDGSKKRRFRLIAAFLFPVGESHPVPFRCDKSIIYSTKLPPKALPVSIKASKSEYFPIPQVKSFFDQYCIS